MYTRMMMMQERSYSSAVFWKHHLFRTFGKSQYYFSFIASMGSFSYTLIFFMVKANVLNMIITKKTKFF